MCFGSRSLRGPRPHLLHFLAGLIVLDLLPSTALATCVYAPLSASLYPPIDDGIRIQAVIDEDLLVRVAWSGSTATTGTFILSTPGGLDVASWTFPRVPGGQQDLLLPGALTHVTMHGFQWILRLPSGLGTQARIVFRVAADCPTPGLCEYRILPGLEGSTITVSEELWDALDEARTLGVPDLLDYVYVNFPALHKEIAGFAWQMQMAEPKPGRSCTCRWITVESYDPTSPEEIGQPVGFPPLHRHSVNQAGAHFFAALQGNDGSSSVMPVETRGETLLGLQLLCTQYQGSKSKSYPTSWPSKPALRVAEPRLAPCETSCETKIEFKGWVNACAHSTVASRQELQTRGVSQVNGSLILNNQSLVAEAALVDLTAASNEVVIDVASLDEESTAFLPASGAMARAALDGFLSVELSPAASGPAGYALSTISTEYTLKFHGFSPTCKRDIPSVDVAASSMNGTFKDGGVAMERWEDPP